MFTINEYYYYKKLFSDKFCDYVIERGLSQSKTQAKVGGNLEGKYDKKVRQSDIVWITDKDILHPVMDVIQSANKNANWNFELDLNLGVKAQFTIYKKNQFYDWHVDCYQSDINRKLSFSLNLSDPSDYTGGEFLFKFPWKSKRNNIYEMKEINEKGSCVIFPSYQLHKVKPVKKGVRYSLVVWLCGRNWR